jgi:hypothetical protein
MINHFKSVLKLALACALLGGCMATPEATPADDASAKLFESAPGAAIVYLYRADPPGTSVVDLWMDGRPVGESLPGTYFRVPVRPGKNLITAGTADAGRLELTTLGGEVYFVAISNTAIDGGFGSQFKMVPPESGRAAILRCCNRLDTWKPGQNRVPL